MEGTTRALVVLDLRELWYLVLCRAGRHLALERP